MDWQLFFAGVGAACGVVGILGGLVWLIITLVTEPLKKDVHSMKGTLQELLLKVMSPDELERMMSVCVNKHADSCGVKTKNMVNESILHHERVYHNKK